MKDGVLLRQIISIIDELDFGSYEETHAFGEIYETILKELQSAGSAGEFYTPRAVTQFMAKMIKPQIGETMADFACGTGGFLSSWIKELEAVKEAKGSITNKESEKIYTSVRLPGSVFSPYTSITTNILFFNNEEPTGKTWFYRVDIPGDRKHFSKTKPIELKHFDECIAWWNKRKEITDSEGNPKAKCYTAQELIDSNYNFDVCGYPHEEEEILSVAETIQNYEEKRTKLNADIDNLLAQITELHQKAQKGEL